MTEVMMSLGSYRFSLETAAYEALSRTSNFRWVAQNRVGGRPAQQFLGVGEEAVEMTGRIYPHFKGGLGQINTMRAEAAKGEPLFLVDGRGYVWGQFAIRSVREKQTHLQGNGAPLRQDFTLELVHYGEDIVTEDAG